MNTPDSREPSEGFFNTPDGKIHYLDWGGPGPQVHFLHANGFCAGTYSPFVKHLIDDMHITASDLRGHGGSDQFDLKRVKNWHIFADDLKMLIEQTMSPPIIGMGHSLGAVTTYIAAAKYPRLFSAIILIDPSILPRRRLWRFAALKMIGLAGNRQLAQSARRRRKSFQGKNEALKRFTSGRGIFKSWSKEFVEAYLECGLLEKDSETAVLKCDPELEAQIFESVPLDVWRYAKKIACPVLAIRGERSDVFTADSAERLKTLIFDYELATIPRAGHFVPMGKPEACSAVIKEFLQRKLGGFDSEILR
ncbi:MAG: alpha/beta hydrolase [Desulfobacterales bacterium]|nr:MAG: alpha/beta hydrolase [Desulfobacterales bacterium]